MQDKVVLLMRETGCERGEAELALEMCGYDMEKAVRAVPSLFHNIGVLKGKIFIEEEPLYCLFLVILNLKARTLLRARAVASYNPSVYAVDLEAEWFGFEKHLYACRLREGSIQELSQDVERLLADFFISREAASFYSEAARDARGKGTQALTSLLERRFSPHAVRLALHKDILDMGQFQEMGRKTRAGSGGAGARSGQSRYLPIAPSGAEIRETPGSLALRVTLETDPEGVAVGELSAGDLVHARIDDGRDVAQYLAKLLGSRHGGASTFLVPLEAVETGTRSNEVCLRVRFSLGVCGDAFVPPSAKLKAVRKEQPASWWRKLFG